MESIEDDLRLLDMAPVNEALAASHQVQEAATSSQLTDASTASRALDMGIRHAPQVADRSWDRRTRPRVPVKALDTFPTQPPTSLEDPRLYERMGAEALFFAFYFLQSSTAQLNAAVELQRCGWRFHKRFNTWFARLSAPRQMTEEYETGMYAYFDFHPEHPDDSGGFCQRVKENLTLEYEQLHA
jgi:CCR4-NOT transcription complex subunit 3